jgi:cbb3-type cytochrome oxidase subunit 3
MIITVLSSGSSSSIGLLVAFAAFVAIVAWVYWFVPAASWRSDAQIPLADDVPADREEPQ